jgi:hypothetical protein
VNNEEEKKETPINEENAEETIKTSEERRRDGKFQAKKRAKDRKKADDSIGGDLQ